MPKLVLLLLIKPVVDNKKQVFAGNFQDHTVGKKVVNERRGKVGPQGSFYV